MVPKAQEAKDATMSWLSPKRRRTTGNLKAVTSGQISNGDGNDGNEDTPDSPAQAEAPTTERPPKTPRPLSQPMIDRGVASISGGNLFYAYARRGDDLKSRYLLTFASAGVANEWWLLVQAHFPGTTRPGPQLFSFRDPDLLSKAWKHERFAHLKTKWLYISFSDAPSDGLGGAAQGIIPVQDAHGNMLGGGSPASPELLGKMGGVKKEAKGVRNEISKLEEWFEKMMEAVERNTEQVAALAATSRREGGEGSEDTRVASDGGEGRGGYFDSMTEISSHLNTVNDLLKKNNEHVQTLAKRQNENDQKLRAAIQDLGSRQRNDYLDLAQLTNHLDRIQALMESDAQTRKDSVKEMSQQPEQPKAVPALDLSPLTDQMEKVREAVEQNSSLIKALLEEGTAPESKPGTPFWGRDAAPAQPAAVDLSPLTAHLESIRTAIESQSNHIQALVGFASGDSYADASGEGGGSGDGDTAERSLAPLGEHLEQIYNAIEEGNKHAREVAGSAQAGFEPLAQHLEQMLEAQKATRLAVEKGSKQAEEIVGNAQAGLEPVAAHLEQMLQAQKATTNAVERGNAYTEDVVGKAQAGSEPLMQHFEQMLDAQKATKDAVEKGTTYVEEVCGKAQAGLEPLTQHFEQMLEAQKATSSAVEKGSRYVEEVVGKAQAGLEPLTQHFEQMFDVQVATRDAVKYGNKYVEDVVGKAQAGLEPLTQHLEQMLEAQKATQEAVESSAKREMDFTPLTAKFDELLRAHRDLKGAVEVGGPPADFGPLGEKLDTVTEHLESLREWTEYQSEHIKELLDWQKSEQAREIALPKDAIDFSPLTERLDKLVTGRAEQSAPALDLTPLEKHLEAVQTTTQHNAEAIRAMMEAQEKQHSSPADVYFTPLTERLNRIHDSLEKAHAQSREQESSAGLGDAKFLMSALTSHLSKIQAVTEQNASAVKTLREKQSSSQDKMHIAVAETADQLRSLLQRDFKQEVDDAEYRNGNDARVEAMQSQVRELMGGQREMVDCVRELAKSITAMNKNACDHVVVPPPRKVGRKVVGFVYDGKDGPV